MKQTFIQCENGKRILMRPYVLVDENKSRSTMIFYDVQSLEFEQFPAVQ